MSAAPADDPDWVWEGDVHPLLLDTVMDQIFLRLNGMDKMRCRQVCITWYEAVMSEFHVPRLRARFASTLEVTEFVRRMEPFPDFQLITELSFWNTGLILAEQCLQLVGPFVRSLEMIRLGSGPGRLNLIHILYLLDKVPRVESLTLANLMLANGFPPNLQLEYQVGLQRLERVYLVGPEPEFGPYTLASNYVQLLQHILQRAPSLHSLVLAVDTLDLPHFCQVIQGHARLRSLEIQAELSPLALEALNQSAYRLEQLSFSSGLVQGLLAFPPSMTSFLVRHAGTLTRLDLAFTASGPFVHLLEINGPVLPNLLTLVLDLDFGFHDHDLWFLPSPASTFPRLQHLKLHIYKNSRLGRILEAFQHVESLTLVECLWKKAWFRDPVPVPTLKMAEILTGCPVPATEYPEAYPYGVPINDMESLSNVSLEQLTGVSLRSMTKLKHFAMVSLPRTCYCQKINCFVALLALAQMKSLQTIVLNNTALREPTVQYLKSRIRSVNIVNNNSLEAESWTQCLQHYL